MPSPPRPEPAAPQPGLASRQDLGDRQRSAQRRLLRILPRLRKAGFALRELGRRLRRAPHRVELFHQVDDPYSHLALQAVGPLLERHAIEIRFHLVGRTDALHEPEPELLTAYARRDCAWVAPHYGLSFPQDAGRPDAGDIRRVERLLAGRIRDDSFLELALGAGSALWRADRHALDRLTQEAALASDEATRETLREGNALRARRRHYSGAMFWYAGDWYWGVDRLHHLERRLGRLGAARHGASAPRFDRPPLDPGPRRNDGRLELEMFPSLRSPYTAAIFDRSLAIADAVGVPVRLRPVMPMVMRGVPAPATKGLYIWLDARREALHAGLPYGDMYDPIGRAVTRGFSLWPWAREAGRERAYLSAFLRAAFVEGRPTGSDEGLRWVVEQAGLDWDEARTHLDRDDPSAELEANRRLLYDELGLWGVPSYRLRGPAGEPDLCVWGQDRLWLVCAEIARRLALPTAAGPERGRAPDQAPGSYQIGEV